MTVRVNDVEIGEPAIAAELQYHPAGSAEAAWEQAALALVVREVLRQEARRSEIAVADAGETPADDAAIEALLAREIAVPTADEETCRRYYEANRRRFRMQDRYLADHILLAAPPDDREAREAAKIRAAAWIPQIAAEKSAMAELAGRFSDCPSKAGGGSLGWVERGQTVPEFETFLFSLEPGEVCGLPVESRYGVHVIRLNEKQTGVELPLDAVKNEIAGYLEEAARRRAIRQYIALLLGRARIDGIDLGALPNSPLVQ
ncbi:MAG: peptidylprolyl isomerase [Alphaproteobacteria bacterium]|nr:peptidylprolyl isomerase [Alphaproteobacteria bacterium]